MSFDLSNAAELGSAFSGLVAGIVLIEQRIERYRLMNPLKVVSSGFYHENNVSRVSVIVFRIRNRSDRSIEIRGVLFFKGNSFKIEKSSENKHSRSVTRDKVASFVESPNLEPKLPLVLLPYSEVSIKISGCALSENDVKNIRYFSFDTTEKQYLVKGESFKLSPRYSFSVIVHETASWIKHYWHYAKFKTNEFLAHFTD